ncbi:hypothetical protein [Streptomyces stelliscabiei]|uniref:Uncharacterized protein n=1 Tax=Streptomyces stelliscabiei TaxID=146820 RepID=A0A8I0P4U4_9ACTN|nr:hypothetical protein [Streptomyces stelliscabiei]MBE1597234.1 hypothetical protein [Streptomyces stelliscabiei]
MARLQILELPEGTGDDRPPFVLVVDETVPQRIILGQDMPFGDYWQGIADKIGARAAIVTPETVEILGNNAAPVAVDDREGDAQTGELIHAHEQTRLALCDALLLSRDTTWHQLIEQVGERQRELAGFYQRLDAARSGPGDAKSTGRPTHPDGTPSRFHEIKAGGWGHCDGCHAWGQWTAEEPHECPGTFNHGPVVPTPGG